MIPLSDNIRARTVPIVNIGIIVACVLVFLLELIHPGLVDQWTFKPAYLLSRELWQVGPVHAGMSLLVSIFLHGGFLHIAGNMLFLWVFGDNVEDRMGHLRYLVFYLVCGAAATLMHSFVAVFGLVSTPHALDIGVVGASGAIAGILGAYLVLYPHASIRSLVILIIFFFVVNIPAPLFIVFWFILQLFSGVGSLGGAGAGVAYWAHIGGFVVGYLWTKRMFSWRGHRRPPEARLLDIKLDDL